jgi:hypothetical protein
MNKLQSSGITSKWKILAAIAIIAFTVIACGGTAATPAPISPNDVSTVVAATIQAITAQAPTAVPTTVVAPTLAPTPTSVPTFPPPQPTQPLPSATRINFLTGATTGVVSGTIKAGTSQSYVVNALQGQLMIVMATSTNNDASISIRTKGGTSLLSSSANQPNWQGPLPTSEDYYITIYGGTADETFSLSVEILARLKFASGSDTIKVSGQTAGGYAVAYTVLASKDQQMSVDLTGVGTNAAITIYGFSDGQPYIRSVTGATSYKFKLPMTQDYVIEVVPMAGKTVYYTLSIRVK